MFSLLDLRFVLCTTYYVRKGPRAYYPQINEVGKSDHVVVRFVTPGAWVTGIASE